MGNSVICIDNNLEKLKQLEAGIIPIYEPGLEELVKSNVLENRLSFSSDLDKAVKESEVCFIAVGTPQGEDGSCDLQYVLKNFIGKIKIIFHKNRVYPSKSLNWLLSSQK